MTDYGLIWAMAQVSYTILEVAGKKRREQWRSNLKVFYSIESLSVIILYSTSKGQPVAALTSSTLTPSPISVRVNPRSGLTVNTA